MTFIKTNNSGSGSGSNKNQMPLANAQGFSSKIANMMDNSVPIGSNLKKNVDLNNFNMIPTSHLKTNNQNLVKGVQKLNDNKAPVEGPAFEKVNFTNVGFSKYPGKFAAKDYK